MANPNDATITVDFVMPNPFKRMLYSRKTWWAILTLVGVLLAHYSNLPNEVIGSILAVGAAMIGSIAWEDAAEKSAPTNIAAGGDATVTTNPTTNAPS